MNIGSSWDAGLAPHALSPVLCPQDESCFMRKGHFSNMLTDIFLQAATAGSSVWMCSERHLSTPIPTPQMPGQGSQPEGAPGLGRRFKLDGVDKLPHALARAAQSTCSDLSIPDFLTRLEALSVSDCE